MSRAVVTYSEEELARISKCANAEHKLLATVFMNGITFSKRELGHYPYKHRRTFVCSWFGADKDCDKSATIYACDPKSLKEFLEMEFLVPPDAVAEKIVTSTVIKLPK